MPIGFKTFADESQVSEPLKELILKGNVHTIDEMRA